MSEPIVPKALSGGGFGWLGSVLGGSWGVSGGFERLGSLLVRELLGSSCERLGDILVS